MEFHIVKRLGQRLLADPALQHFYAVLIAHDARFLGAGAQSVDQLGGPPMGMHVDHGYLLCLSSNGLTLKVQVSGRRLANYRAIYSNRRNEASAFTRRSSVQLGLQAFGVFFVIVLCVGRVLAVAAGREVAVGRGASRTGIRIPQLGAYEGLRAVIERL